MGFLIYCDNKKCGKDQEPLLDVESNEVICIHCQQAIKSVTHFTKVQMKALGQVKRNEKKQQAFAVKCSTCKKESPPVLEKDNTIHCGLCAAHLKDLPAPFAQVIRNYFKAQK